ncbi:MAG: alpha-L-arabinofuranosidase C-terminal domain-containing protein [Nitrososphaerota archaeon]|nr:alpha-N-arabinofuranosidase [Candidatus Calditenuaceae archaeon]MDW8073308.1 alpha-L-arabinofuranosidase C-terminal domain-containing protein [Nitrososphaerota archaeon]
MSGEALVRVDAGAVVGGLDRRVFGQFIEHLGRCIYGGIWVGEGSRIPNLRGFRSDVLEAVKRIAPPVVRWPGGNFASAYHWMDGVGPRATRPRKFELAWEWVEPNEFGTVEYIEWCRLVGAEPFIVVNAGSGSPEEAAAWVEYCNSRGDTHYASLRRRDGFNEPFNVKLWGIGNELYGRWQVGFCVDGEECARRTVEFANLMKRVDKSIELVGVGCDRDPEWNIDMVKIAGNYLDYLSVHTYIFCPKKYEDLLAAPLEIERNLISIYESVRLAASKFGVSRKIKLAFDEWNVWYREAVPPMHVQFTSMKDAVFTGLVLVKLQKISRMVPVAALAQTVNVLPLISTSDEGAMVLSPQYYVFELYAPNAGGKVAWTSVSGPTVYSEEAEGQVEAVDAVASFDGDKMFIHLVNGMPDEAVDCGIKVAGFDFKNVRHRYLASSSPDDRNTFEQPNIVVPREGQQVRTANGEIKMSLPPCSVNLLTLYR